MGRVRAVSRLCVLHPGIYLTSDGKSKEKTSVRVVQKCQVGMIQCVDMSVFVFQKPGHTTKGHAPWVCLRGDSGFGRVRSLGSGHERPTWLLRGEGPGQYRRVYRPILGGPELPAAVRSLFAHDISYKCGQGHGPSAGPWVPGGGLWRIAWAG